jgi:hypothetical protein
MLPPQQLQALTEPNAVKNTSLNQAHSIIVPMGRIGLEVTGFLAVGMDQGGGPVGEPNIPEEDLVSAGLEPDQKLNLQFTLAGRSGNFNVGDVYRLLNGYQSDQAPAPDPNFQWINRIERIYAECLNDTAAAGDSAILRMPAVLAAVKTAMEA